MHRRNILLAALLLCAATVPAQGMRPTERAQVRQAKRLDATALAVSATQTTDDWTSTVSQLRDGTPAAVMDVTNGQAVVLTGFVVRLNSSGGTNNGTNTITFEDLDVPIGLFAIVNTSTSNHLAVAKTGTWKSAAVELGEGEGMIVIVNEDEFCGVE